MFTSVLWRAILISQNLGKTNCYGDSWLATKKYLNRRCFPAYFAKVLEKGFSRNSSNCSTHNLKIPRSLPKSRKL